MKQLYVYCIADAKGIENPGISGLGGARVYALAQDGLTCLISQYEGEEFGKLSKEEVIRSLLVHQSVVEKVMEQNTVLPVRFGTLLANDHEASRLLTQGRHRLLSALATFQNSVEIEVAATWDTTRVLQELANTEQIMGARAAMSTMSPGEAVQYRIRAGQMLKEAMDHLRENYQEQILASLKPVALEAHTNVLLSDQMVMNVAFLMDKDRQPELDERVRLVDKLFEDKINFRVIGPLPPYTFATVEVTRPDWARVEGARQYLQLGDSISEPQIRLAYRRQAAAIHPDLLTGREKTSEHWARLREASETLISYCRGVADSESRESGLGVTKQDVERSLLINISRTPSEEINERRFGGSSTQVEYAGSYA